ncbi:MAG TPA: hypothetical protein VFA07_04565 [Chthonomonadaceae bacterium]|nr:hypothetical protein [Chthonomonadaceae bacterium]
MSTRTNLFSWKTWILCCTLLSSVLFVPRSARATVEMARKESRACQYCHVSNSPGFKDDKTGLQEPTTLNERGKYYLAHHLSFEGYVAPRVTVKPSPALFHFVWGEVFSDPVRRIAVADVTGDKTPRLVMLSEVAGNKEASTLTVRKWDGKTFATEFTADVKAPADKLEVGRFAGENKPAVIVTGDALFVWNGTTFARKPSARPLPLFGSTRLKNGEERLLLAASPTEDVMAYRVNPDAGGTDWLVDGMTAPNSSEVRWGTMNATPDFFEKMGLQPPLSAGGLIGLWDARQNGTQLLYYPKVDADFDIQPDPKDPSKPKIQYKGHAASYLIFRDPTTSSGPEVWSTPRLNGFVYDVARQDPKDGKPGLLILGSEAPDGKSRVLYFFAPVKE